MDDGGAPLPPGGDGSGEGRAPPHRRRRQRIQGSADRRSTVSAGGGEGDAAAEKKPASVSSLEESVRPEQVKKRLIAYKEAEKKRRLDLLELTKRRN